MPRRVDITSLRKPEIREEMLQRMQFYRRHYLSGPPTEIAQRAAELGYEVRRPAFSEIYFNDSRDLTIFTGGPDKAYFEFSIVTALILRAFFFAIMSEESILRDFDDVELLSTHYAQMCSCDWKQFQNLVRNFSEEKFLSFRNNIQATGVGAHSGRNYLGVMLSLQTEAFLIHHEMGHHDCGHIRFQTVLRSNKYRVPVWFRHVFELEADETAKGLSPGRADRRSANADPG